MADEFDVDSKNGIATICFGNADEITTLTHGSLKKLIAVFHEIELDETIRCVLITGAAKNFMAGADVREFDDLLKMSTKELHIKLERQHSETAPLWPVMDRMPQPILCSVRGFVVGGAIAFITAADLAIASENAKFILAQIGVGLSPDVGTTYHLPRQIGMKRAKEMALLGVQLTAIEAKDYGLVNWVVPDSELEQRTEALAHRLAASPPIAIREAKRLLNRAFDTTLPTQLEAESMSLGITGGSPDFAEGVSAFLEKRSAKFSGR